MLVNKDKVKVILKLYLEQEDEEVINKNAEHICDDAENIILSLIKASAAQSRSNKNPLDIRV